MKVEFLIAAEEDLFTAIDYYNEQQFGLGFEFSDEIKRAIERIIQFSDAWASLSENSRRCLVNRFPYGVIYQKRRFHTNCSSYALTKRTRKLEKPRVQKFLILLLVGHRHLSLIPFPLQMAAKCNKVNKWN